MVISLFFSHPLPPSTTSTTTLKNSNVYILDILPSCLALTVTKTLRLTEKLLPRSKEGSFLYCSLPTVPQTA